MIGSIIEGVTTILDKVVPDADEKLRLAHEISTLAERHAHENAMAQIAVNQQAAAHKNIFVAGARPATLWICNLGLLWAVFLSPIAGIWFTIPEVDTSLLLTMLGGLLGFGGFRMAEKMKGVARES